MELRFDNRFDLSNYGGKLFKAAPISLTTTIPLPVDPVTPEGKEIQKVIKIGCSEAAEKFVKDAEAKYKAILLDLEHRIYAKGEKELPDILRQAHSTSEKAVSDWLEVQVSEAEAMIDKAKATFESVFKAEIQKIWATEAAKVDKKYKKAIADQKIVPSVKIGAAGVALGMVAAVFIATLPVLAAGVLTAGVLGGLGVLKKMQGGIQTVYLAITKDWPRHKTAAEAVEKATVAFEAALRQVTQATKEASLGRPKAAEAKKSAQEKAGAAQLALMDAIKGLDTWNRSLQQDIENGAKLVMELEKRLEQTEKALAAEKSSKKAQELRKACDTTVQEMGRTLDSIELARTALADWEKIVADAKRLVATKDCTPQAAGSLAAALKRAATSDQTKQVVGAVKVMATAVGALVDAGND